MSRRGRSLEESLGDTPVDADRIRETVDDVVRTCGTRWLPDWIERRLYTNTIVILMRVFDAFLAGFSIGFLGHELVLDIRRQRERACKAADAEPPPRGEEGDGGQ